jgi:hypothetical protein
MLIMVSEARVHGLVTVPLVLAVPLQALNLVSLELLERWGSLRRLTLAIAIDQVMAVGQ